MSGTSQQELFYSDVNITYGTTGNATAISLYNLDTIKAMLLNLIMTERGSRHFEPTFGGNFPALVFQNVSPKAASSFINKLYSQILIWLPMVTLDKNNSSIVGSSSQTAFLVTLTYSVQGIQAPQTLSFLY